MQRGVPSIEKLRHFRLKQSTQKDYSLLPTLTIPKLTLRKCKGWWELFRLVWKFMQVLGSYNNFKNTIAELVGRTPYVY